MIKTTLKIEGMMCSMCEAHMNDKIREVFKVKKVTSSHAKGETVVLSEEPLDRDRVRETVDETGYRLLDICEEPYEKKGLFGFGK